MQRLRQTRGFTLIELLVTMGLIVVLLSIAVVVANSATLDSYKILGAGDKLSQALLTAKTRAARDKAPRGVRLLVGTDGYLRELIYIEQPDNLLTANQNPSFQQGNAVTTPPSQLVIVYPERSPGGAPTYPKPDPARCIAYLVLNTPDAASFDSQVQVNSNSIVSSPDLSASIAFSNATVVVNTTLQWAPTGTKVYRLDLAIGTPVPISSPDLGAGQTPTSMMQPTAPSTRGTFQTTLFGVYLGTGANFPVRPLAGEPTVILSKNAAVDPLASLPQITGGQNIDILFSPAGHVMYRSEGLICFLVRDTFKYVPTPPGTGTNWLTDAGVGPANKAKAGEMVLVTIYPKTGTVVTKPVSEPDPSGTNPDAPYQFAKDAINSGL